MRWKLWAMYAARGTFCVLCATALQGSKCLGPCISGEPGCTPVDQITTAFQSAMSNLSANSAQWQATLNNLETTLIQQGQQTLANQVQNVIDRGIAAIGLQVQCTVDFLAARLKEEVNAILLAFQHKTVPPPVPFICSISPTAIDLRQTPDQRPATLNIYGFNFSQSSLRVTVVNTNGGSSTPPAGLFNVSTNYLATFNLVNYPFGTTDSYLEITTVPANGAPSRVTIDQAPVCGGVGQPCCTTGTACGIHSGCLNHTCTTCPNPWSPAPVDVINPNPTNAFQGNDATYRDTNLTFGGACPAGTQQSVCNAAVTSTTGGWPEKTCDGCTCQASWQTSSPTDCRCVVHFHTDADTLKGIHCDITVRAIPQRPPWPAGCP
jgi:hypothetical protein